MKTAKRPMRACSFACGFFSNKVKALEKHVAKVHADLTPKKQTLEEEMIECLRWTKGMTTEQGWKTWDAWRDRLLERAMLENCRHGFILRTCTECKK